MKNAKRLLFSALAALAIVFTANAQGDYRQDPRYGTTPEERQANVLILNYFNDAYAAKNYDAAVQHLRTLLEKAPKATENLYIKGVNIYKQKIAQAQSLEEKNHMVDTLMNLYDLRAANFGDHETRGTAYILANKAHDYAAFKPADRDNIYAMYEAAINAMGSNVDADLMNTYFNALVEDYKQDMVETDMLLNEYDKLNALFESSQDPAVAEGKKVLESLLISSGAANCENLEKLFKPRFAADPNNVELMTKIVALLSRGKCDSPFQLEVAENLYKVQPTPETGLALAAAFEAKGDYQKSLTYWQEAIDRETNPKTKSNYIMRAAGSALGTNNYRQAADFAKEALAIDPENGIAYMILGQSYGASVSSLCSDFARQTAYWLVVDTLVKARNLLSGDAAQVETLNKLISSYSAGFPTNEDCFFRDLNPGSGYTVNCGWISGHTTVRVR